MIQQRILLVDDKKANIVALRAILSDLDVELIETHSGSEALGLLLKTEVSLVLLDVQMPGMDGFEVAELMRSRQKTRHIPIIFVTAIDSTQNYIFKGYQSGGIDFLSKPFNALVLTSKVKIFLEMDRQKKLLEKSLREVKQLETSNDLLLQFVGEGIIGLNDAGFVTFVNPAANMMLNFDENELVGKCLGETVLITTKSQECFSWTDSKMYLSCSKGEKYQTDVGAFNTKDGQAIPVEYTATPVNSHDNKFTGVVVIFKDITERKKVEEKLNHMAQYDALTGLGNRNLFSTALESAINQSKTSRYSFSLLYLDLDRFKQVNDSMGHDAGDLLLQEVTDRLHECIRDVDTICRLGGDEFAIIIQGKNIKKASLRIAEKVLANLSRSFCILGQEIYIGASIGIVSYPDMAEDASDLVKKADMAMYQAKNDGRNRYRIYQSGMETAVEKALDLERKLRKSINELDFSLHYQPKNRVSDGAIIGVEALLRWQPDGEMISPEMFIPIAEETGLIEPLGQWVIESACSTMQDWHSRFSLSDEFALSINLSSKQLKDKSVLHLLSQQLEKFDFSANRLELEITESLLMQQTDKNISLLSAICELGFGLALDDFGTGYSSMSYLAQLPLTVLKIDQSFVGNMDSERGVAIIKAIISLAEGLSLQVVAEGVETETQLNQLKAMNVKCVQGFYYSKPLAKNDIEALLSQQFQAKP